MDAFYASVELLRRPELRGRPVAIGGRGDPSRRGVVTTATYEARAFGIRSGVALSVAARLCPDCVFLPVDFDRYREVSRQFKRALAAITPAIEDRGIDEVYLDLTDVPAGTTDCAGELQRRVREATGLTCSIGVAPNKLVAKIASDLRKPAGVTVVAPDRVAEVLGPLEARRIPGIGPKAAARLGALGVGTIAQLAAADPSRLETSFGARYARWLARVAAGEDDRPLDLDPEPRSRSRETTFERDLHPVRDWQLLARTLAALSRQVADDLRRRGYRGRTVGIKLRFADFRTVTRDRTVATPVDDAAAIRRIAFECLQRVPLERPVRLAGVRVGELTPAGQAVGVEPPGSVSRVRRSAAPADAGREAAAGATLPLFEPDADGASPQGADSPRSQ
jgi:DNA polymerase-4